MCIWRPLRLEALCPHSSHTNSFSPRCLKASCRRSSVRDRKHLEQVEHCKATGEEGVRVGVHPPQTHSYPAFPQLLQGPPCESQGSTTSSETPSEMGQPNRDEVLVSAWICGLFLYPTEPISSSSVPHPLTETARHNVVPFLRSGTRSGSHSPQNPQSLPHGAWVHRAALSCGSAGPSSA